MFLAAFSGALAGMGISNRRPTNATESVYAILAAQAGASAISFDQLWDDSATADTYELQAAQTLAESAWQERTPSYEQTPGTVTPATYDDLNGAIVAIIRAGGTYLTGQGITPPAPGGGSANNWPVPRTIDGSMSPYDVASDDMVLIVDDNLGDVEINFPVDADEGRVLVFNVSDLAVSQGEKTLLVAPAGGTINGEPFIEFYVGGNTFQCLGSNVWTSIQGLRVTVEENATSYAGANIMASRLQLRGNGVQATNAMTTSTVDATVSIPGNTYTINEIDDTQSPFSLDLAATSDITTRTQAVLADCSAGAITIDLTGVSLQSQLFVKDIAGNSSVNNITVVPPAGYTIDGAANFILAVDFRGVLFGVFTGTDISVMALW